VYLCINNKSKDMTIEITTEIKNYNGKNPFVLKMKQNLKKYGSLTPNQLSAVEKILVAVNNIKSTELSDDMKKIVGYAGTNTFVNDLKTKLEQLVKNLKKNITFSLCRFLWTSQKLLVCLTRLLGSPVRSLLNEDPFVLVV